MTNKTVCILGGGLYGIQVATKLDKEYKNINLILVDQRDVLIHKIGSLRPSVTGSSVWLDRILVSREKIFKNKQHQIRYGTVIKATANEITFEDQSTVTFDVLILATGAINSREPSYKYKTRYEIMEYYDNVASKIANAKKHIVVVGGGITGIEMAGEIRYIYPDVPISIVTGKNLLSNNIKPEIPAAFIEKLNQKLVKNKITVLNNTKIDPQSLDVTNPPEDGIFSGDFKLKTSSGNTIDADLVIVAIGSKTYNEQIYPKEWLSEESNGLVNVDNNLRVVSTSNVFAVGDCANIAESKFGGLAPNHAAVVAANVVTYVKDPKAKLVKTYEPNKLRFAIIPLGMNDGISYIIFATFNSWVTRNLKGKTLFSEQSFGLLKQEIPVVQKNWHQAWIKHQEERKVIKQNQKPNTTSTTTTTTTADKDEDIKIKTTDIQVS